MKAFFRSIRKHYQRFTERQGFPIVITVCVCIITATALWTRKQETPAQTPPFFTTRNISAAQLLQQSLQETSTPSPAPTEAPQTHSPPLEEYSLLTAFSTTTMQHSSITGIWSIHDAVDLQATQGTQVLALADGVVICSGQDQLQGAWIRIDHGDGLEALYAGMETIVGMMTGDEVQAGAMIGRVGSNILAESDLPPHLHLRITKHGTAIDPITLWE